MHGITRPGLWRSRWAAIGAAVAVTLGAGGLVTTFADSPASNFVAISPVRVLDTRLPAMAPALISAQPRLLDVTGAIPTVGTDGSTITTTGPVPDGATAIVANVTIVGPTTPGFVAVRPATATGNPTTSSLNASAGGVIVPNSVTVEVPTTSATAGQIQLWFQGTLPNATTDLLVDIVGYYQAGGAGPAGPPGPAGPAGLSYIGSFSSAANTGIGNNFPPLAPNGYTATFDLEPGRYFVTGDLTVANTDPVTAGSVVCYLFIGETRVGQEGREDVSRSSSTTGLANLAIANTFEVATAGPTTVSYRCVRFGPASMIYSSMNLTVFKVG